jgi:hypothetical protein
VKIQFLIFPLSSLALISCVVDETGTPTQLPGTAPLPSYGGTATQLPDAVPTPSYGQPLTAVPGQGDVTIREGGRTLSSFRTASPNVEETRWYAEQEQIVVKSRGNHGPATVQLFESRTGRQLGQVMAYDIRNGQPVWAAGMAE